MFVDGVRIIILTLIPKTIFVRMLVSKSATFIIVKCFRAKAMSSLGVVLVSLVNILWYSSIRFVWCSSVQTLLYWSAIHYLFYYSSANLLVILRTIFIHVLSVIIAASLMLSSALYSLTTIQYILHFINLQ